MSNIQDEYINQHVSAAQITNTIRLSRFFLVSIVIVSLYIYCIYQFYFAKPSFYCTLVRKQRSGGGFEILGLGQEISGGSL